MFNLEEFEDNPLLKPIVDKLNKFLSKKKVEKLPKIITQLEDLLDQQELLVSTTYILSILAENKFELLTDNILSRIDPLLDSDNYKLRLNAISIIGFAILADKNNIEKYFQKFTQFLIDNNPDIRENTHYFLQKLKELNSNLFCSNKKFILKALEMEKNEDNLTSLLSFLELCNNFTFKEVLFLRRILNSLLTEYFKKENSKMFSKLFNFAIKLFPSLKELDIDTVELKEIQIKLESQLLMKRYDIVKISKENGISLKDIIKSFKKMDLGDIRIYFYTKIKENNNSYIYEIEKEKLIHFFEKDYKISAKDILNYFYLIENDFELNIFINTLIKLKYLKGYFSELGFYYPYDYLKSEMLNDLQAKGLIDIKKFDYLPPDFILNTINEISSLSNQTFLKSKDNNIFYSLKSIQQQINSEAAKLTSIDLKPYRVRLSDNDFIKLIKNLPNDYLTSHHKGTQWLTNLGLLRIKKEIENSKIIGFYSIPKISEKLNVSKILLIDVIDLYVDPRSGVFDNNKENFYYAKFLQEKIDEINLILEVEKKEKKIGLLADELNIKKNHILGKIDENLQLIKEEIRNQDQIKISDYLEKTGMLYPVFMEFISEINLNYFRKGDLLIFNETKIEEAKKDIKSMLIEKSKMENFISLGDLDITSSLVENLLRELQNDEKIVGIFYNDQGEMKFYTEKGLENLMLENSFIFSFHDFFNGKELSNDEIELLSSILNRLIKIKRLKGSFEQDSLTYSSYDVLFAQNYNAVLDEFEKMINRYIKYFNDEFQKIKNILTKQNETIFPREIKIVQESIDRINEKYVRWRSGLEAFIRNANIKLLKKQGYTIRRYKTMLISADRNEEIKSFEMDPEVLDLLDKFNSWVKLFNELEIKYGNIIFYQKRLIQNPDLKENRDKLNELLDQLNLT